ncbi:DUF1565 domain-containing protein [Priestia megaterium]|uniref:DUF1565 domain-containing protein n=1 Tax=Priestia megaterium TaxID=1404 RepID=UPI002858C339|nr:DUF1565 domain-containing protein [Priestia megaterium]MDR7245221.1 hypothetical protein [Priestia megaterium]
MKKAVGILLILLCCINQRVEAANQPSAAPIIHHEIYVSPTGDDKNLGTKSKPFRTLRKASEIAQPGTTVYIRGGIYYEQLIISRSGTKQEPIIFRNYKSEKPLISGEKIKSRSTDGGLVSIKNKSYITIQGLNIGHFSTSRTKYTMWYFSRGKWKEPSNY